MGFTLKTTIDTWFTSQKAASANLSDSEKTLIPANTELAIGACLVDESFLQITLSQPLQEKTQWFVKASGAVVLSSTSSGRPNDWHTPSPKTNDAGTPTDPP